MGIIQADTELCRPGSVKHGLFLPFNVKVR